MSSIRSALTFLFLWPCLASGQTPTIPAGTVTQFVFDTSEIYPGTVRDYWVYVPAQYDGAEPAALYVGQDGIRFDAPAAFDTLIAAGDMPVTIGVFVMHGRVLALSDAAGDRYNRSYEFDRMNGDYARFLSEELLPHIVDELDLNITDDPNMRAIGGSSTGAIAAFTAAWERPDLFRRVFSAIGTYVGFRGGNDYPNLIRKFEPKPIRVFLEDGSNDLNHYSGDWWMANQTMERALTFAGYEVAHVWGDGAHSNAHAQKAGIGMPDVGIFPMPQANAFATGWNRNSALVAVSAGLLQRFNRDEARAVIGHEIGHVANGDMITLTLIQGVVNTFVMFFARLVGFFVDRVLLRNEQGLGIGYFITSIVMDMVFGVFAMMIVAWFSRRREYSADAAGAHLASPNAMIAALARIKAESEAGREEPLPANMKAFGIYGNSMAALLASHPPLEDRILALQNSAR